MINQELFSEKKYLESTLHAFIERGIQTIIRRMIANIESAIPAESLISTEGIDYSKIQCTIDHNYNIEKTVAECKESIIKLRLIQKVVKIVNKESVVHFLQHYSIYSLKELEYILGALVNNEKIDIQDVHLLKYN